MTSPFTIAFVALSLIAGLLFMRSDFRPMRGLRANVDELYKRYIVVYVLAVAGDWMQGPHVYALYDSYGMSKHDIELLFAAGFGSSMLFGTFVGSMADVMGRKCNCILYGVLYALSCVTKHFNNFAVLLLGRLLGGIATSILCSAFEAWLVHESFKLSADDSYLKVVFSSAILCNSLVAIACGVVAHYASVVGGFTAPFDVAITLLIVMTILIALTWTENYGNQGSDLKSSVKEALAAIYADRKVALIGVTQALFEGSMYTFVLEWTPVLNHCLHSDADAKESMIPHGVIFSCFMVAVMLGSFLFNILTRNRRPEVYLRYILCIGALTMLSPILLSKSMTANFIAFIIFEICVGIFWPAIAFMRGVYVPEKARATIMNIFRVPLNLVVVIILLNDMAVRWIFTGCFVSLLMAAIVQHAFYRHCALTTEGDHATTV